MPAFASTTRGFRLPTRHTARDLLIGAGIVAAATALAARIAVDPAHMTDAAMLYLLGVVVASLRLGAGASLATALLSVVVFDYIFIPPYLGFVMKDLRHLVTFVVMLVVAVVINSLARQMRDHAEAAASRERRTAALCDMSRELGAAVERKALVAAAARHLGAVFDAEVVVLAPEAPDDGVRDGRLRYAGQRLLTVHRTAGAPTQFKLLAVLVRHVGKVVTHGQLLNEAWGPAYAAEKQYLRVYMGQLRSKLEPEPARPRFLITEPGVGYRLQLEEEDSSSSRANARP